MQKLIFILLIILILFLIFNYSKEHFQNSTTTAAPTTTAGPTTQAIINDDILMNIGLNNVNTHNLISCVHEDDEDNVLTMTQKINLLRLIRKTKSVIFIQV